MTRRLLSITTISIENFPECAIAAAYGFASLHTSDSIHKNISPASTLFNEAPVVSANNSALEQAAHIQNMVLESQSDHGRNA